MGLIFECGEKYKNDYEASECCLGDYDIVDVLDEEEDNYIKNG